MADIAEELKTYLKSISAVTDLVGSGTAARIYTHRAKQGVTLAVYCVPGLRGAIVRAFDRDNRRCHESR
jgi:hypothetical protein